VTRLIRWCLLLGVGTLAGWNAMGQSEHKEELVLPGTSVAGVKLGDDAAHFEQVFPKHPTSDNHSPSGGVGDGCPTEIYYWSDLALETSVVTAYLNAGQISQISTQGPLFSLPNDLKTGATEEQVEREYPKGLGYVLSGSASRLNGGRNLVYWVDRAAGVAFKLTWWPRKKERTVSGIDIFPKGSDFRPEGCISPPQQWKKLKS
jgi:hypothetical protein